jgi:hypothetical protein
LSFLYVCCQINSLVGFIKPTEIVQHTEHLDGETVLWILTGAYLRLLAIAR